MDQTQFLQMIDDLNEINPDLAKVADMETDAKWVYLIEACNYAAKQARDTFQELRNEFKSNNPSVKENPPEIKEWDKRSGRLMGAAKNLMLPHALENGAQAYLANDAEGKQVLLLKHEEVGMIALHSVNPENLSIQDNVDGVEFTGFRRQRLAAVTAKAVLENDKDYLGALKKVSIDTKFADVVHNKLGGLDVAQSTPEKEVVEILTSAFLESKELAREEQVRNRRREAAMQLVRDEVRYEIKAQEKNGYVPLSASMEHINRHFAGSLNPGSKFLPMDEGRKQEIIAAVDMKLVGIFADFVNQGNNPKRVVFQMDFNRAIGTDALTETNSNVGQVIEVVRDAGTENETSVKVVPTETMPETSILTVVAGPYGPTGKWGIYTMFPGEEAPAFPNAARQSEADLNASKDFWSSHGFYATVAELQASVVKKEPVLEPKIV